MNNKSNPKKSSVTRIPFLSRRKAANSAQNSSSAIPNDDSTIASSSSSSIANTVVSSNGNSANNASGIGNAHIISSTTTSAIQNSKDTNSSCASSGAPNNRNAIGNPGVSSDASSLSGVLHNMKIGQEKERGSKEKKSSKSKTFSNVPMPGGKEEKDLKSKEIASVDKLVLKANGFTFVADKVVGNGSFGVVIKAIVQETKEMVAIKKVLQDNRYKNREVQIMQMLAHPCIVELKTIFYTNGEKNGEVYLNLVLEYVPDTLYRVCRHYTKLKQTLPIIYSKLYTYQLLRALGYIHSLGICHRDIKPQNLLLDPQTGILKLCDFGSAKILVKGEPNVSYICSRYYRAPELIFGATNYSTQIDIWSSGCVLAELLIGQPIFPGESGVDQLVEIIKVLGTPTREEIQAMNPTYTNYKFPQIKGHTWSKIFRSKTPSDAIDLVAKLLQYIPTARLRPYEALSHPFFDDLRSPSVMLPNGRPLPDVLFNFSEHELRELGSLATLLIPEHYHQSKANTTATITNTATTTHDSARSSNNSIIGNSVGASSSSSSLPVPTTGEMILEKDSR